MRKILVPVSLMAVVLSAISIASWQFHRYGFNFLMPGAEYFPSWDLTPASDHRLPQPKPYVPDLTSVERFKSEFGLSELMSRKLNNRYALLKEVLKWSSSRWAYDGNNDPETSNPLAILEKARTGQKYRCVEFAEITVAAARVFGFPARVLKLRRKDAETAEFGAGHVVAEVWLSDMKKWAFVDAQFGVIPEIAGIPLSVTEFVKALKGRKTVRYFSTGKSSAVAWTYPRWVGPYLYFIQYDLDQRLDHEERAADRVVLTPKGVSAPLRFQRQRLSGKLIQTTNASAFDASPAASLF